MFPSRRWVIIPPDATPRTQQLTASNALVCASTSQAGYQSPPLTASTPLADTLAWRSHGIDPSGFYNLGARYYDPLAGHFLSADPLGHAASMDLHSFCNGDPINRFDPTGRFGKSVLNGNLAGGFAKFRENLGELDLKYGDQVQEAFKAIDLAAVCFAVPEIAGGLLEEGLGLEAGAALEEGELGGLEGFNLRSQEWAASVGESEGAGLAETASSARTLANTFTESGQGEFGFARELESSPARTISQPMTQSGLGASQAQQLELRLTTSSSNPNNGLAAGRRGNAITQAQLNQVRDQFLNANPDYMHVAGGVNRATGERLPEEYLPPLNGGRKGGSYPDLTFEGPDGSRIRINTVDTYSDGMMTSREQANFDRIFEQTGEPIIAIPKPKIPKF